MLKLFGPDVQQLTWPPFVFSGPNAYDATPVCGSVEVAVTRNVPPADGRMKSVPAA